jgi:hypothetical protein
MEVKFHEEFLGDSPKSSYPWKDKFHLLVFGDSWKMDSNCNEMMKWLKDGAFINKEKC